MIIELHTWNLKDLNKALIGTHIYLFPDMSIEERAKVLNVSKKELKKWDGSEATVRPIIWNHG